MDSSVPLSQKKDPRRVRDLLSAFSDFVRTIGRLKKEEKLIMEEARLEIDELNIRDIRRKLDQKQEKR